MGIYFQYIRPIAKRLLVNAFQILVYVIISVIIFEVGGIVYGKSLKDPKNKEIIPFDRLPVDVKEIMEMDFRRNMPLTHGDYNSISLDDDIVFDLGNPFDIDSWIESMDVKSVSSTTSPYSWYKYKGVTFKAPRLRAFVISRDTLYYTVNPYLTNNGQPLTEPYKYNATHIDTLRYYAVPLMAQKSSMD